MAFNEEDKTEAYEGTKIIVDNDDVLFVESNSYTSAKYFGPDFASKYYTKKYRNGDLFFIFDKKDPYPQSEPHIYTIFRTYPRGNNKGTKTEILDPRERDIEISELIEKFPQLEDIIIDTLGVTDIYTALVNISKGVEMNEYELNRIDDLITDIRFNKNNPKKSMITLKFNDLEDYAKLFYDDQNEIWFILAMFSRYSDYEFEDYYWGENEWKEGYLIQSFSDENTEKVKGILKMVSPKYVNLSNDDECAEASKILYDMFDSQISNIISDYTSEKNICKRTAAEKEIEESLCDPFINYGIFSKDGCFWKYVTTVNVLLSLYKMFKTKNDNITELLTKLARMKDPPEFYEYAYETECYDFDDNSFQNSIKYNLDRIMETLEDSTYFPNLPEYQKIIDVVLDNYDIGTIYELPSDKDKRFRITNIDPKTNKIFVDYGKNKSTPTEKRSYDLEGFNDFLHSPELFEQKIRRFNK